MSEVAEKVVAAKAVRDALSKLLVHADPTSRDIFYVELIDHTDTKRSIGITARDMDRFHRWCEEIEAAHDQAVEEIRRLRE